jgi:hypothetical protein
MVDVNLILTIIATVLAIAAAYLGINHKSKISDLLGKTKLGLGHFQTGISEIANITTEITSVLSTLTELASGEPVTPENIEDMRSSLNSMLASGQVLHGLIMAVVEALRQIG